MINGGPTVLHQKDRSYQFEPRVVFIGHRPSGPMPILKRQHAAIGYHIQVAGCWFQDWVPPGYDESHTSPLLVDAIMGLMVVHG